MAGKNTPPLWIRRVWTRIRHFILEMDALYPRLFSIGYGAC